LVVLCLLLASVAHAKESGKPSNFQTSGSADSCPASEKTLLTRRARNIQGRLALEDKAGLAFLIEQKDGDEWEKVKKAKEFIKEKVPAVVDGLKTLAEKAQDKFTKTKAKKEKFQKKLKVAKANFEAAKEKGGEILAQAKAIMEQVKGQFDEAVAAWEEATADLDNAGLIELEDGDEKGPIQKAKKLKEKAKEFWKKLQDRVNKAQAKKEKSRRNSRLRTQTSKLPRKKGGRS